jgi:hypothetical protein
MLRQMFKAASISGARKYAKHFWDEDSPLPSRGKVEKDEKAR